MPIASDFDTPSGAMGTDTMLGSVACDLWSLVINCAVVISRGGRTTIPKASNVLPRLLVFAGACEKFLSIKKPPFFGKDGGFSIDNSLILLFILIKSSGCAGPL